MPDKNSKPVVVRRDPIPPSEPTHEQVPLSKRSDYSEGTARLTSPISHGNDGGSDSGGSGGKESKTSE
jgi:hypothetical protein